jgi:hypothetical protein
MPSQARWALTRGLAAVAAGLVLAFAAVTAEAYGLWIADLLGIGTMLLVAGGAMVAAVGGILRPLQQKAFRHGIPGGRLRDLVLRQPVLRWWYGVDAGRRARDD